MKGNENFRTIMHMIISIIAGWVVFSLIDLPYEIGPSDDYTSFLWLIIPAVYGFLYFRNRKKLLQFTSHPVKSFFALLGLWALFCSVFGIPIGILAANNTWIIPQNTHSAFFDLNGIEYIILWFFDIALTLAIALLGELVLFIIRKVKNH